MRSSGILSLGIVVILLVAGLAWTMGEQSADPGPASDTDAPIDADTDLMVTTASSVAWSEEVDLNTTATKINLRYLFTNQGDEPLVVQFVHAYLMSPGEPWHEFTHIANLTNHAPFGLTPGQSEGREFIGSAINDDSILVVQVRYVSLDPDVTVQQETDVYLELPIRLETAPIATPSASPIATPIAMSLSNEVGG
jgi:hypothetical protein